MLRPMQLSAEDIAELTRLEEAMWIAATRFDAGFQQERFAPDFCEIGRSGRVYTREEMIFTGGGDINGLLPLDGLEIRRAAVERGIPCITSIDTARAMVSAMAKANSVYSVQPLPLYRRTGFGY